MRGGRKAHSSEEGRTFDHGVTFVLQFGPVGKLVTIFCRREDLDVLVCDVSKRESKCADLCRRCGGGYHDERWESDARRQFCGQHESRHGQGGVPMGSSLTDSGGEVLGWAALLCGTSRQMATVPRRHGT